MCRRQGKKGNRGNHTIPLCGTTRFACVEVHGYAQPGVVLELRFVPESKLEQCVVPMQVEFLADICTVIFDSAVVNEEFGGNLLA